MSGRNVGFSSTTDEVLDGDDLAGVTVLVTGASTGLGEETSRALAAHGAKVLMAVRDRHRGEGAAQRIRAAHPDAELDVLVVDLASLSSVRHFAGSLLAAAPRLDVLIANAGLMACPFGRTTDGFELQWGTNHLGHFLLANLVRPAMVAAGGSRLVSLSSAGHRGSDIDLADPGFDRTPYDPFVAYGRAKTANALFAVGWERRFGDLGHHAFSVHPGGIHTELGRHMTEETVKALRARLASAASPMEWKTVPQGAATSVWAATAAELDGHGGAYLEDCGVAPLIDPSGPPVPSGGPGVMPYALDAASADRLWEYSMDAVGLAP